MKRSRNRARRPRPTPATQPTTNPTGTTRTSRKNLELDRGPNGGGRGGSRVFAGGGILAPGFRGSESPTHHKDGTLRMAITMNKQRLVTQLFSQLGDACRSE